jgi:uncharacterized protein (TIGR02117 family)
VNSPPPVIKPLIVPRASEVHPPIFTWPRAAITSALVLVALGLLVGLTSRPGDQRLYPGAAGEAKTTVYLVDNGFHTDLVLPRAALFAKSHAVAIATADATDKPWIEIGWGDSKFYTERGMGVARLVSGVRALLAPGNHSVVHIEGLASDPQRVYPGDAKPLQLTGAALESVLARVDRSLAMDSDGLPQRSEAAHQSDEGFFRSVEHFSLVHLCNHWTAELLNAAGLPITPVIDTLPVGLHWDLSLRAGVK